MWYADGARLAGRDSTSDDVMEAQNDGRVDELSSKVAMLKAVRNHGPMRASVRTSERGVLTAGEGGQRRAACR